MTLSLAVPRCTHAPGSGLHRSGLQSTFTLQAVAENQPKNRMNSSFDLSGFALRVREFIRASTSGSGGGGVPECQGLRRVNGSVACSFEALALELFSLQFRHNRAYRRFCQARGTQPESVSTWEQIPAIPTSAFKELEVSCLPPQERTMAFFSSGTSRQPRSRHFHNAESLAAYEASLWPWFRRHCLAQDAHVELLLLTPAKAESPNSSLVHMLETVRKNLDQPESVSAGHIGQDGAWTLDFDAVLSALEASAMAKRPLLIVGTAFLFVHLLDHLAALNLRFELPPASRVMETGGYKGRTRALPREELHASIAERFGIRCSQIICEYGMSELSSQAYDRSPESARRLFRFPPWARVQIVSPETGNEARPGQAGLISVFDLANVYSVMAVQTEDLGLRHPDGFELLGRAALAEPRGCSLMSETNELAELLPG